MDRVYILKISLDKMGMLNFVNTQREYINELKKEGRL